MVFTWWLFWTGLLVARTIYLDLSFPLCDDILSFEAIFFNFLPMRTIMWIKLKFKCKNSRCVVDFLAGRPRGRRGFFGIEQSVFFAFPPSSMTIECALISLFAFRLSSAILFAANDPFGFQSRIPDIIIFCIISVTSDCISLGACKRCWSWSCTMRSGIISSEGWCISSIFGRNSSGIGLIVARMSRLFSFRIFPSGASVGNVGNAAFPVPVYCC